MNVLQAVVLGIVQGLGEFLPISSSAHLVLVPWPSIGLSTDLLSMWLYIWVLCWQ